MLACPPGDRRGLTDETSQVLRSVRPEADLEDARLGAAIGARLFGRDRPATVGRFRIQARLGSGGMGVVYGAHDPTLQRDVALKVLRADSDDDVRRRGLLREARAAAKIRHPHVVEIFDTGEDGGQVWIAMERCPGQTLRQWSTRPRSWRTVVGLFVQCGEALAAGHRLGVVHRDFKPHNVIVEDPESEQPRAKVVDFGLAAVVGPAEGDAGTSLVGGTPGYVAPEQVRGDPVDGRADQFSLCVALHEVLTGYGRQDLPRRPRAPRLPRWLLAVIERGRQPDREQRFPTMDALVARLRGGLARRRRIVATSLGTLALGLGLGGAWSMVRPVEDPCLGTTAAADAVWNDARVAELERWFDGVGPSPDRGATRFIDATERWIREWRERKLDLCQRARDRRVTPRVEELGKACLRRRLAAVAGLIDGALEHPPSVRAAARAVVEVQQLPDTLACDDAPALLRETIPEGSASDLEAIRAHDRAIAELGGRLRLAHYGSEVERTEAAVDRARALSHAPLLARALRLHGHALGEAGRIRQAITATNEAYLAAIEGRTDEVASDAALLLAWLDINHTHDLDRAEQWLHHARAWIVVLDDAPGWAEWHDYAGALAYERGDFEEAEGHHERSLALRRSTPKLRGSEWASLNGLAMDRQAQGKLEQAEQDARAALQALRDAMGPEHPYAARVLNNLGAIARRRGNVEQAYEYLHEALAHKRSALGDDSPELYSTLTNLGTAAWKLGRPDEALRRYREALDLLERALDPDDPRVAPGVLDYAISMAQLGRHAEALESYHRADSLFVTGGKEDHRGAIASRIGQGQCLVALGRPTEAREVLERALVQAETSSLLPMDRAELLLELARLRADDRASAHEARPLAREAQAICADTRGGPVCEAVSAWLASDALRGRAAAR